MDPIKRVGLLPADETDASIVMVGDLSPAAIPRGSLDHPERLLSPDVRGFLSNADISIVNLECPLTVARRSIEKLGPALAADPAAVGVLQAASIGIAICANNHIMDQGVIGLQDTFSVLDKASIRSVGAGVNLEEASRPCRLKLGGKDVALLAFAEEEFSCATAEEPGAARLDPAIATRLIQEARNECDLVVVSVHGGSEFYPLPTPRTQRWYRSLVDSGAGAVIGHHPHVVQGIEVYRGAPIVYSLGNFLFPVQKILPACWYRGIAIRLNLFGGQIASVEVFPLQTSNPDQRVEALDEKLIVGFSAEFENLSQLASDPEALAELWRCYCSLRRNFYAGALKLGMSGVQGSHISSAKAALRNGDPGYLICLLAAALESLAQSRAIRGRKVRQLKNLLVCPSHHEVLTGMLDNQLRRYSPSDATMSRLARLLRDCD